MVTDGLELQQATGGSPTGTYATKVYRNRTAAERVYRIFPMLLGLLLAAMLVVNLAVPLAHSLRADAKAVFVQP